MGKEKEPNQVAEQEALQQAADLAAGRMAQPFDFTGVIQRSENMKDPELVIHWESRFSAHANSLGSQLIMKVAQAAVLGTAKPDFLTLSRVEEDQSAVVATPTLKESSSTVPIRWIEDGSRAVISLQKLFSVRRFPIPRQTTVHIPISEETIENLGPSLILHLNQAVFAPIDAKERDSAAKTGETAAPQGQPQGE